MPFPLITVRGRLWALWTLAAVTSISWVAIYVGQEDPAYLSDFHSYWKLYWVFGERFEQSPFDWSREIVILVKSSEYNPLFTVGLLPFNLLFGRSRIGYIEAVTCVYMIPAMFLTWQVTRKFIIKEGGELSPSLNYVLVGVAVFSVSFWIPTLRGYPDVLGLIPLSLATWYLWSLDFSRPQRWTTLIGVALLLYSPILIRKWYVFAVSAVIVASCILAVWQMIQGKANRQAWGVWVTHMATVGFMVVALAFILQGGMVLNALNFSYADAYIAFQRTGSEHLSEMLSRYGLLIPLFSLSGWWLTTRKNRGLAKTYLYLFLCMLFKILFFTQIQGLGFQHHLPLGLFIAITTGLSIWAWSSFLESSQFLRRIFLQIVSATLIFNYMNVFFPSLQLPTARLLTEQYFPPLKLINLSSYQHLAEFIEREVEPHQRVSILGSNATLSQTLMENFLSDEGVAKLAHTAEVDEYEGFNLRPLYSDFLVIPSYPQVIDPTHQRVITIPTDTILRARSIGAAYEEIVRFPVRDNLDFLVFRKVRAFHVEELLDFLSEFRDIPRPPGYGYTPMELALLGAQTRSGSNGVFRIDQVGGGQWRIYRTSSTELEIALGFWLETGVPYLSQNSNSEEVLRREMQVFSIQLSPEQLKHCGKTPSSVRVSLRNDELMHTTLNDKTIHYISLATSDLGSLRINITGGGVGCDQILISHRTD